MAADPTNFIYMKVLPAYSEEEFRKLCGIGSCKQVANYRLAIPRVNIASGRVSTSFRHLCPKHAIRFKHLELATNGDIRGDQ